MSVLDELLKKHRQRIMTRETAAFRELLQAYSHIEKDLRQSIRSLQQKIDEATKAGETISKSWFLAEQRLSSLVDQVKNQIERFGGKAAAITTREQRAAIQIAIDQTQESIKAITDHRVVINQIGSTLTPRAVENAVGMMGDGSPILEYYRQNLAPKVAEMIRLEVIKAAGLGTDFKTIANRLMQTGQITKSRALTVARTEVNRVRRETTLQMYRENANVITGWEWVATKSPRTCPVCLALDGRIFQLKDEFPQHVNCRCTLISVIAGFPRPARILGPEWFAGQSDEIKQMIIGKEALAAYNDGDIHLEDFIGWRNSKEFGRSVYTKPLSAVLMNK